VVLEGGMMIKYVVLEAIRETGDSSWLVCSLEFDKVLEITNTCRTKEEAVLFAARHATEDRKRYDIRNLGSWQEV
jgi:hypothetical protein